MKYNVVKSLNDIERLEIGNNFYVEEEELRVARTVNSVVFEDISNAFKVGKIALSYVIYSNDEAEISNHYATDLKELYDDVVEGYKAWGCNFEFANGVEVLIRETKGVNTFSPLHLKNLKPLDKMPKKWNLNHVKKLLANGAKAECKGRYTDDYAYDAAINYGEGEIDTLGLLKDITEHPSGWWVYKPNDEINVLSVNCHHFNNNNVYIPENMVA